MIYIKTAAAHCRGGKAFKCLLVFMLIKQEPYRLVIELEENGETALVKNYLVSSNECADNGSGLR